MRGLALALALPIFLTAAGGCSSSGDYHTHFALGAYVEPQSGGTSPGSVCEGMPMSAPGQSGGQVNEKLWIEAIWSNEAGQTKYDVVLYHYDAPTQGTIVLGDTDPPPGATALGHWTFDESQVGPKGDYVVDVMDGSVKNRLRLAGRYEGCDATKAAPNP
jgi:hypothetical protein